MHCDCGYRILVKVILAVILKEKWKKKFSRPKNFCLFKKTFRESVTWNLRKKRQCSYKVSSDSRVLTAAAAAATTTTTTTTRIHNWSTIFINTHTFINAWVAVFFQRQVKQSQAKFRFRNKSALVPDQKHITQKHFIKILLGVAVLTHNLMVNQVSDTLQKNQKQSEEYVSYFRTQDISTVIYSARLAPLNSSEPFIYTW